MVIFILLNKILFKEKILRTRNRTFNFLELFFLFIYKTIPRINFKAPKIILFSPRGGRGLKVSEVKSLFFDSLPKQLIGSTRFLEFNSRFWIITSIRLLIYLKLFKKIQIILIQYVPDFHASPSINLLEFSQYQGADITKVWLDSYSNILWEKRINRISHLGAKNIIVDTPNLKKAKFMKGNSYSYCPIPIETFPLKPFLSRTNFLYYSGGIEESGIYKPRKDVLDYLKLNNFAATGTHYDRNNPGLRPDYQTYRDQLANSFIGLNFTWKGDQDVLVARTWEILSSGVLLLQNKSNLFQGLFTSGVHYLEFSSNAELLEILKKLKKNVNLLTKIAMAGKQKYEEMYSAQIFWKMTLNRELIEYD